MGLCCSRKYQQQIVQFDSLQHQLHYHNEQQRPIDENFCSNSPYDVRVGVAMVMEQARALVEVPLGMDVLALEDQIRKAKAEGRTVTITNGRVYFDYRLIGNIPSDENFDA
ncbi:unnamed protein product [Litomosoides sigmodontis]|uniref:Uncharacterized protein n=1 Tax=Litomosoides sigmodontis TaxID=42156 RepID=A0A3P6TGL5_LITSI|nr:unnamed protein product [Litomosoides sigmodontis]